MQLRFDWRSVVCALTGGAALALMGCGNPTGADMASTDLATTMPGDMATPKIDALTTDLIVASPEMATPNDLVMPSGDMPAVMYTGTVVLADVSGKATIGGAQVSIRQLAPVVGFGVVGMSTHDFDDRSGGLFGCYADHYDATKQPASSGDAGPVKITMYTGGTFLNGMAAPSEINCARLTPAMGPAGYKCGYGPLMNGMPGMTTRTPYPGNAPMIMAGQTIQFALTGGTNVGAIDTKTNVTSPDGLTLTEDLSTIKYDATKDTVLHFTCAGGNCGFTAIAVNISVNQNTPATIDDPSPTQGAVVCAGLASAGMITVSKGAIAAMFATDAALKTVQTTVLRVNLPYKTMDAAGNSIQFVAGRGSFGISPK